jgi:muramoyltetrapeptide carboxypeptidase
MLTHLKMAGKLERLAGLVLGDFTDCEGPGSRNVREIITEVFHSTPYPVVMGMPAGHGRESLTLPFGVKMALDADAGTLSLIESPVA